jgi:hypothetical protein
MSSFNIESTSLSNLLLHLNENQMKMVFGNKNISNDILKKLRPYSSAKVITITNNKSYLLQDLKKDTIAQITISHLSNHINPELEVFTLEHRTYKEVMDNYQYNLTLLKNTYFDKDIVQDEEKLQKSKQLYHEYDIKKKSEKKSLENKWNEERESLYSDRKSLIIRNKEIYDQRKTLSNSFYELDKSLSKNTTKKEYIEQCRILLQESEENKNSILEINQKIDVLDRKCNLYLSETFFYTPLSEITIKSITKEEAALLLSKKGGKYKNYDIEFLEGLETEPLEDKAIKRYYYTMKNNIKKVSKNRKSKSKTNLQLFQDILV